jgi:hypothetical protein
MKFLMTYAQNPDAPPPTPEQMMKIAAYGEKNAKAGVLLMQGGLVKPTRGIQVKLEKGRFTHTDGPFAETKELLDGFALIEVKSYEEAIAVAKEFMSIAGDGQGEILPVIDPPSGPPPR